MSVNDNNVTKERHRWTKAERQYIKSIVHNYSLQRWTDQDIVNYLQNEKKIKIGRSTVTTIKNQVVEEAGDWYLELRESGTKTIAFFKERLDSLLSYQKKLNEILTTCEVPEIRIRAIAELHRIEMSLHTIFQELPHEQFQIRPEIEPAPAQDPTTKHCYCHYCLPGIGDEGEGPVIEQPQPIKPNPIIVTPHSSSVQEQEPSDIQEPEEEEETESERYWRMNPVKKNTNEVHYPGRHKEEDDD